MSLQGPLLLVAGSPGLVQALTDAGVFPIVEASWAGAATAAVEINPAAIVVDTPDIADPQAAQDLVYVAQTAPFVPLLLRVRADKPSALPAALAVTHDAPPDRLIAQLGSALRLRTLHATVIARASSLESERNIVAELPSGDPLDDATVLLIGRGRHHPTLSVAVGERMGVMGALSIDQGAGCLKAREVDGVIVGDGLPAASVDALLTVMSEDARFRDLPVAVLGSGGMPVALANGVSARDPLVLLERVVPLIRMHALEASLKRLLSSIEHKGMIDAQTGLFSERAFGDALGLAVGDAAERGSRLSLARFTFEQGLDRRASMDAARLISRLVRDSDFACRQDDGSILFAFGDTDLRDAHVVARRLASVLKHTMLRPERDRPEAIPSVTLATLKPSDTALTLLARVGPRPVAAA